MNLQLQIQHIFSGLAFARPLFYNYPHGLRFELAEGGSDIERFLLAVSKATAVCRDLFAGEQALVVCLRTHTDGNGFARRELLRGLQAAGIRIPAQRSLWSERLDPDDWFDEHRPEYWLHLAFKVPLSMLQPLLWCALSGSAGVIRPSLCCGVYLFNLNQRLMVWPYDDRGMDVVGPNHALLSQLYRQHQGWLLDYDRERMDASFATVLH
ncbi:MAG: DUF3885 domain-containing protein [Pseudomonas sp.]|uniref:DUF3885 domain-containing protein n=1 Tax=unclassified Pseudomonas TaxID=196821 RepID=UPI00215FD115|nr:DUF3885 domain-containing protein [Pseudomonas sp. B21-009]UVM68972.1 DUF3885 domain-containing protein [Pseudomonas sp. B21-009]